MLAEPLMSKTPNRAVHLIPMPSALLSQILRTQDLRQKQAVIGDRGRSKTISPCLTPFYEKHDPRSSDNDWMLSADIDL